MKSHFLIEHTILFHITTLTYQSLKLHFTLTFQAGSPEKQQEVPAKCSMMHTEHILFTNKDG